MTIDLKGRTVCGYQLDIELGRGGMGTVYRAETSEDGPAGPAGTRVAIKVFHPELVADERSLERFRREAEIGKRVRHPHVVRTFDVDADEVDGQPVHFMSMEYIEGQTLDDLQADLGTVPEHLLFQIADQVLNALDEIHTLGVIHRDIKPENIVITPDHRVLLMDLGIARMSEGGHTLTEAGEFVGSLFYAAPEQFIGQTVTGRCDLYAFGMVLYKLATGVNPYEAMDLSQMLGAKLQNEVDPPTQYFADLDPFWSAVIVTATRREIAERFKDAAELRAILQDGDKSGWWLARTADRATPSALPALKRLRLQRDVSLIGRTRELESLRAAYQRAAENGHVLALGGPSGVGKSRLVFEFIEGIAASSGPAIGAGRCVGRGGRNYHPFLEAFGDLLSIEELDRAELIERLRELLPNAPGIVEPLAAFVQGDAGAKVEKDALLAAGSDLLRSLAAERPVVMVIEDLHLAGPESLDMFAYLARCVEGHPILLVGVYADDEVEDGSPLHEVLTRIGTHESHEVIKLAPLSPEASDELVGAVVLQPRTTSALAYPLHARTDGNPHVMLEILAHLKTSGALVPEGEGFQLVRALDDESMPASLQDLVNLRLGKLDEDQREVLEAAAILGYMFDAPLLAAVLEVKKIKLLQRLAVLERKFHLIKSSGRSSFRFVSHQLQEAVYESISPALRIEYHAVVAEAILEDLEDEQPDPATAYALLRHLLLSEQALEGEPHLEPALEYAGNQLHAADAAVFFEKLGDAFRIGRPPARLAIATRLWNSYEMLSRHSDELRVLDEARVLADEIGEPGPRGRILSCLAATHWLSGEMDKVAEEAPAALELLTEADDRLWIGKTLQTLGGLAYRKGNLEEAGTRWRKALELRREIGDRKGEISSMMALAAVMPAIGEAEDALPTKQAALTIAREIGERRFESGLLNNIARSLEAGGDIQGAIASTEEAVALTRELGDQSTEAIALGNLGNLYASIGHVDRAKQCLARAIEVFREIDRPNSEVIKRIQLGEVLATYGDRKRAQEELLKATQIGMKIDSLLEVARAERTLGRFLHEWGKQDDGWQHLERALTIDTDVGDDEGRATTLTLMGHARLNEKQFDQATELLEGSLAASKVISSETLVTQCRLASALKGAGKEDEAKRHTTTAEKTLQELANLSPEHAPEIHFRLSGLADDEDAHREHLTLAQSLVSMRANTIRNGGYREHFMTQSGHNPEIMAAAKEVASRDSDKDAPIDEAPEDDVDEGEDWFND